MSGGSSYYVDTEAGRFWIRSDLASEGQVVLSIDGIRLGAYGSAASAADDVRGGHTGFPNWDNLRAVRRPQDLTEWKRVEG